MYRIVIDIPEGEIIPEVFDQVANQLADGKRIGHDPVNWVMEKIEEE